MKDFMYIIRGGDDVAAGRSPEEMQKHMQDWQAWMGKIAEQGRLVGGEPLALEGKTIVDNGTKVIDRPLAEGKELVGGYLIFKADTLEEATNLAKGCPGFEHNCSIEVRAINAM